MLGIGVQKNIEESNLYFKLAADNGNTDGMLQYGLSILPEIVYKNKNNEVFQYIKKSADNGNI